MGLGSNVGLPVYFWHPFSCLPPGHRIDVVDGFCFLCPHKFNNSPIIFSWESGIFSNFSRKATVVVVYRPENETYFSYFIDRRAVYFIDIGSYVIVLT